MQTVTTSANAREGMLRRAALFESVPREALEAVVAVAVAQRYDTGEPLFLQGQDAHGFCVLVEGRVKVSRTGADGREQVLHVFRAGDVCGEVPVFQGKAYPASAFALSPVRALYVPRRSFLALSGRHPDILLSMLAVLSLRLRRFVQLIDDLSLKEVSARLAKHVLDLAVHTHTETVELESSKTVLASRLGTVGETLSRTLRKMQEQDIIAVHGRTIRLIDRDRLAALSAGARL